MKHRSRPTNRSSFRRSVAVSSRLVFAATLAALGLVAPTATATAAADACATAFAAEFNNAADGTTVIATCDVTITEADNLPLAVSPDAAITLDLNGHSLDVTGPIDQAGIGVPATAALTIVDGSGSAAGELVATAGPTSNIGQISNPGIGTGAGSGAITINSGTVTATGGLAAAGIGASYQQASGPITINGGTVIATGGRNGAGIGSSDRGQVGPVVITGGTVAATGGEDGAGIGGGIRGIGVDLTISSPAVVTVSGADGYAIGGVAGLGTVTNSGTLVLPTGESIDLKSGTLTNDGTLSNNGTLSGSGTLAGTGTTDNAGAITHTVTIDTGQIITGHHYALSFDGNGGSVDWGSATPWSIVDGPTLQSVGRSITDLPTATWDGYVFNGWYLRADTPLTETTEFEGSSDGDTPVDIRLAASWYIGDPAAVDRFVELDGDNSGNDCLNPDSPCRTIDYAVRQVFAATPFNPVETVHVGPGTYPEDVSVAVSATTDLTIVGSGPEDTVISGSSASPDQILWLQRAGSITLQDLAVAGNPTGDGILVTDTLRGDLTLTNVRVAENDTDGIDLQARSEPLTVTIDGGSVEGNGDTGIEIGDGPITLTVTDSTLANNDHGIVLIGENSPADVTVSATTITGNDSEGAAADGGTFAISASTIDGNGVGVGTGGTMTVTGSTISDSGAAGASVVQTGTLTITGSSVADNQGPAVQAAESSTVRLVDTDVSGTGIVVTDQAIVEAAGTSTITEAESAADLDGGTLRVPGSLTISGTISGDGTVDGTGTLINNGAIRHTVVVDDTDGLSVLQHHYALTFDGSGGHIDWVGATPWRIIDGPTLRSVGRSTRDLPTATRSGYTFHGWFLGDDGAGDPITDTTELDGASTDGTPVPITLYAGWTSDAPACTPAGFAADFNGAADGDTVTLCGDLTITADDDLPLTVPSDAAVTLDLDGHTLDVTAGDDQAGIGAPEGTSLRITDDSASATGRITATGGDGGAGIGGYGVGDGNGNGGAITIDDGSITANGGYGGAGIGGAYGDAGAITVNGGTVTSTGNAACVREDFEACSGAGIGGGHNGKSGTITINGGTVTATGNGPSAGIGGGGLSGGSNDGRILITGGEVTAIGGNRDLGGGSGIGAAAGRTAGPVTITGGTVHTTGGRADTGGLAAAGIGAGNAEGDITIGGGDVTATGGTVVGGGAIGGGAGIGGRSCVDGAAVTITGSGTSVAAVGVQGGAGIGGGGCADPDVGGNGGEVTVGAGATVTVTSDGGNAIGNGAGAAGFGSLDNAGTITLASPLTIPAGVTVANDGLITAGAAISNGGTITGGGTLDGSATVDNAGAIWHTITVGDDLTITDHHYALVFDSGTDAADDGAVPLAGAAALRFAAAAPATLVVYGPSLGSVGLSTADLPVPIRSGYTFAGWFTDADATVPIADDTVLSGASADGTPVTVQLFAAWEALPPTTTTPTSTTPTTTTPTTTTPTTGPTPPTATSTPTSTPPSTPSTPVDTTQGPTTTAWTTTGPASSDSVPPAASPPGGLAQTGAPSALLPILITGLLLLLGGGLVLVASRRKGNRT